MFSVTGTYDDNSGSVYLEKMCGNVNVMHLNVYFVYGLHCTALKKKTPFGCQNGKKSSRLALLNKVMKTSEALQPLT